MLAAPPVAVGEAAGGGAAGDDVAAGESVAAPLAAGALAGGVGVAGGAAVFPSLRPRITKMPRATSAMTTTTNSSRCLPGESSKAGSATGADGGRATTTAVRGPGAAASVAAGG